MSLLPADDVDGSPGPAAAAAGSPAGEAGVPAGPSASDAEQRRSLILSFVTLLLSIPALIGA